MKDNKLRVGVIGVGHLGEYHVQKYKALPTVDLVGVVDTDEKRVRDISERYGTNAYTSHHDILEKVDAVSLAVPTEKHYHLAKDILSQGVHLLVEKPITYQLEPADTLIKMAHDRGLVLQVGLVERYNPAVVKMQSFLNKPIFIESHRMNVFTTRGTDVDVVLDLMIHDLDIILHVIRSEVKEVHAVGMSVVTGKTDIANVRIIFEDGTVANLTASRVSDRTLRKIRVFQQDAYLSVDCLKRELSVTRLDTTNRTSTNFPQITSNSTRFPDSDPLADQIRSFVNSVINGSTPVVSGEDGRRALKYALGIIDQIERGCKNFQEIC
ncbi:MAG: Gfo/Idh/MocA family oxidoreductase [Deltaproteobacteria bacterium]|nr:Gfo/Idh/MocA family oxidoreductase [Deltaproteobacteria bacterium]MBW1921512.1 Gfo/Idh/MocA family oxidoreductase [Deltaproteobacteria bacterium]MBW1935916.1 Gfo/Idh/MocA family oxidoreductase [Deltaproteobacteria bacterium]MBW1977796.1 Gfo/Idh/MocA family oxidoreductase [Deltaproteobacteria bacterium]MBW2044378.1 Gfo/Idh/MocA family oxidoreductase [Deltaproteobacteria bacterium]